MEPVLDPNTVNTLKQLTANDRARNLARAEIAEELITRAKEAVSTPSVHISTTWVNSIKHMLKHGLNNEALYIVVATLAQEQGLIPDVGVLLDVNHIA